MVNDRKDALLHRLSIGGALSSTLLLIALYLFIAGESLPIWRYADPGTLLLGRDWQPVGEPVSFGLLPMIVSTLWASLGAMLLSTPLGIGCGIFLSEYAPKWISSLLRAILYMLTGIPSVVYGFLGAAVIVPWYERVFGVSSGESLFCASLVLAVMVVPYIVAGTFAALQSIPADYREAGTVLGVSKSYIIMNVLAPLALRNMVSAVTLAFARAAGETMAVLMLAGNTLTMPLSWFSKGEPLSALIALEIGSAEIRSPHYQALFAAGFILLLFVTFVNFSISYINSRRRAG